MKIALQVVFRDIPKSEAVEAAVRKHAAKLDEFCDHIMSCRVTVEEPARHKHQGKLYSVHIDVKLVGKEISATRHHEHEDVYVAIRDAFDAVKRQIEDHVRKERGQTKLHEPLVRGRVVRLLEEGHGFIEDADGNEYYFDRASVVHPNFEKLEVGMSVEFLAELAAAGRQAKRVSVPGGHAA
jgi:ribosomal subunit interface protein